MAMEFDLVAQGTRVTENGTGAAVDVTASQTRTFLLVLQITGVVEQESLDVSIYGSEDGQNWLPKPILKLPQRFYRSETRMVLDLTSRPEVKVIRAGWELNRWGRVSPLPVFVFGLHATEVPAMPTAAPRPHEAAKV
jgi:hypothetical protein